MVAVAEVKTYAELVAHNAAIMARRMDSWKKPQPKFITTFKYLPDIPHETLVLLAYPIRYPGEPMNLRYTVIEVQNQVCSYFGITTRDLLSARRTARLTPPRHIAMMLAKHLTSLSLVRIGQLFKRDHTTVLHAERKLH